MVKKLSCLFLDRDGVINARLPGAYVQEVAQFAFEPGVLDALARLRPLFERVVVVTNQAGIGKGLMREADLALVHAHLQAEATAHGCPLDAIYHCPHRAEDNAPCRKPNTGMGAWAKRDFPEMRFEDSWMVGDSASDIEFGQRLGMRTALVRGKEGEDLSGILPNVVVDGLRAFWP
jgi:D-glycero-D-manno-heptose 1,7-bisphosphate phosphatase